MIIIRVSVFVCVEGWEGQMPPCVTFLHQGGFVQGGGKALKAVGLCWDLVENSACGPSSGQLVGTCIMGRWGWGTAGQIRFYFAVSQ